MKVGKEFFISCVVGIVEILCGKGFEVFFDLKFYDILNIMVMVVKVVVEMGVWMVNVYCFGGLCMMVVCCEMLEVFSGFRLLFIGVIVLISMECEDLVGIGFDIEF